MRATRTGSALCILLAVIVDVSVPPSTARAAEGAEATDELVERLDRQDQEIEELREEVEELRAEAAPPPKHPDYFREDGEEPVTEYVNRGLRLDVAAQINQAMNLAADGNETRPYFVDNDATNSRVRLAGVARFEKGPEVGATLEIAFSGNNSFDVSQDNPLADDFIQVRRADMWVLDERFGRLMFGRGNAAAENSAEYDLSIVGGPIMLSGIAFPIGGLQFTENGALSGVTVGDAFFNFDGNRQNRIRYDTPMWGPFQLSGSAGSDERYDVAITVGGDYGHWTGFRVGPFTGLGAVSFSQPNVAGSDYRVASSLSFLHRATGLSLTVSGGTDTGVAGDAPYNVYGKLAWDTPKLLPFGETGFGVDYTWTENVSAQGDQGQSVGFAAVQQLRRYGVDLYGQLRWLTLDRAVAPDFDDLVIFTLGSRVRF